jgi:hypothetical protein
VTLYPKHVVYLYLEVREEQKIAFLPLQKKMNLQELIGVGHVKLWIAAGTRLLPPAGTVQ